MEEVFVKEFHFGGVSPYFKLFGRVYQRGDEFVMKMLSTSVNATTGDEKTTLFPPMNALQVMAVQNNISMAADFMCFEQPSSGMHIDSLSYCFAIECTYVTKSLLCTQ